MCIWFGHDRMLVASNERGHLRAIDAIRGWAIIAVIVLHVATYFPPPAIIMPVTHEGVRGVQLFFVASAFTLFLSSFSRCDEETPILFYFIRRFFRIVPLYYAAFAFWMWFRQSGFYSHIQPAPSEVEIVTSVLFANGWHPELIHAIVPGGWSVVVEMNFYLILPILIARVSSFRDAVRVAVLLSVLGVGLGCAGYFLAPYNWQGEELINARGFFAGYWLPISIPPFMAGMVVFFAWRENRGLCFSTPAWLLASLGGMLAVCYLPLPLKNILFTPLLALLVIVLLRHEPALFVNALTRYLGRLSYSAYFTHFLVIDAIVELAAPALPSTYRSFFVFLPITLLVTIVLSELTFRLIEEPSRSMGRFMIRCIRAKQAGRDTSATT